MIFRRWCAFVSMAVMLCGSQALAQGQPAATQPDEPLRLVQTITLPGATGRVDHMALDLKRNHLFVALWNIQAVEVIDLSQGTVIHRISPVPQPQGVIFLPELDSLVVSSGTQNKCLFYDGESFELQRSVDAKVNADALRYDPAQGKLYLGYLKALAVIDPKTAQSLADISLDAHPEAFELEKTGKRIFVNLPETQHIAVVDRETGSVVEKWPTGEVSHNNSMALDEANHRLFVACSRPARFLVFDTQTGKTVQALGLIDDCDDMHFDSANKRIYASCGSGTLDVFEQIDPDHYKLIGRIPTSAGARTSLFSPEQKRVFITTPPERGAKMQMQVRIYEVVPAEAATSGG